MTDAVHSSVASSHALSEDWLAFWIGLLVFGLALAGLAGTDLLGWAVTTTVWVDSTKALGTASKTYAGLGGLGALIATYVALLAALTAGVATLRGDIKRFAIAFTATFWIAYASWIIGNYARLAAVTPADLQKFGMDWSLRLTNEGGFIALIAGLAIANDFPRFADWLNEAIRPELLYQDRYRDPWRLPGRDDRRQTQFRDLDSVARHSGNHRSLFDLLVRGLFRGPQMVRFQPGMGRAARLGHLDLRRIGRDRDRERHPGTAGCPCPCVFPGHDFRGRRSSGPAISIN
jgi:hypothetical protein